MLRLLILCFLAGALGYVDGHSCPAPCTCKLVGPQNERLRVKCNKDIQDIKEVNVNSVSIELYHLDLSKNSIYIIEPGIFQNLTNLKRLDLSINKITALEEGCFSGLENVERLDLSKNQIASIDPLVFRQLMNLKKLDLSGNKITSVETSLFHDLVALERLKLNGNLLKTLSEGTFHGLKLLRQLDLTNNPWDCDCYLYWLSNWKNTSLFKLTPAPTCTSPSSLHGQSILDLRFSDELQCQFTSPVIDLQPDQNQVVFAGDSMTLRCSVPSITDDRSARLNWSWNPSILEEAGVFVDPQDTLANIKVENRYLSDSGVIDSSITIFPVRKEHNGQWNCELISAYGNRSKTISMIVISEETSYCPLVITRNNKGMYAWPRTVVGWRVELPCEGLGLSGLVPIPLRASYHCNATGSWVDLNTEACPFISPITKALEQYSKVNLSLTKGNLLETAIRFKNHTGDPTKITDPIEIHFIAKTIENYLNFLVEEKELGAMLIDVVSSIMNLPKDMLKFAETSYNACTRLIKAVELITEFTPSIQLHKTNMALEEFRVKRENFGGLTCTWYIETSGEKEVKLLHCATNNKTSILSTKDKAIEASIQLPPSLLRRLDLTVAHQLMISMYTDNSLFPVTSGFSPKIEVTSGVIGAKLIGLHVGNLTEPVYVMLKVPSFLSRRPKPVIWDTLGNTSEWSTSGCELSNLINDLVVFHCDRLGYYGLLEDTSHLEAVLPPVGEKFRYSNPAIYIGTFVIISCLTITSVTYIICHASIIMPKRAKHCVVNTWASITLLCFLYAAGIQQTDNLEICQSVGLVLHYLSLCCLLWMAVTASTMYKRLAKPDITQVPDDEIPEQPIQKPLLGLYLVGWGIALIVCGISGAINLREYASYSFCFLSSGAALAALFVPAVILIFYLTIFYLLVRCAIRSGDHNGQLSEGTQATENMDLELLEPNDNRADQNSVHSTQTVSSEVEDVEHSQITQLKGHIVILVLYLILWCAGAATTARPFHPHLPHEETIFAVLYAIAASSLGFFVLLFYGIARSDVRSQWTIMRCWLRRKKNRCCRTRGVTDANPSLPAQPLVQNLTIPVQGTPQIVSDTNSLSSSRLTSASRACNALKISDGGSDTPSVTAKGPNMNLVVLHRQQYRSNNSVTTFTEATHSVEMFYNPHQSGVARKFFKKQRRHTKHNNLGPRKQGDGGATSDGGSCISIPRPAKIQDSEIEKSIFGSSAKVNNTNIHVELNPVSATKNPNILSDSGGSISEDRTMPIRYVIGQENTRSSRKVNNDNHRMNPSVSDCIRINPNAVECIRMDPNSGSESARMCQNATECVFMSPNESDLETRTEEEKHLRNVSQQCSLEYSSELDSGGQMLSERSDHDLPEIGETPETPDKITEGDFKCSSLHELSQMAEDKPLARSEHSSSLYCLSEDRFEEPPLRTSYRSSYNDVTSLGTSSRNCEDFESEEKPTTDENSRCSSFSNVNRIIPSDEEFVLLNELTLPNLNERVIQPSDYEKEYSSMNDLTAIDVTLGATRHLDMNASIGVDYEDANYENSQHFSEDGVPLDDAIIDANHGKKETSV